MKAAAEGVALRPKACAECYRRRVKCVFADGGSACERCAKLGKRCRRRVLRRGRSDSPEAMQRGTAAAMIKVTAAGQGAQEHLVGAIDLGKLFAVMGHSEAPQALRFMVNSMLLVALRSGSVERLHAATCAAAAWGMDTPFEWLTSPPQATEPQSMAELTTYVESRCQLKQDEGASFVYRVDCGACDVAANATFTELFLPVESLVSKLAACSSPLFDAWHVFLEDEEVAHAFLSEFVLRSMTAATMPGGSNGVCWSHKAEDRLVVVDRAGQRWTALVASTGAATETACVFGVSLQSLQPEGLISPLRSPTGESDSWSQSQQPNQPFGGCSRSGSRIDRANNNGTRHSTRSSSSNSNSGGSSSSSSSIPTPLAAAPAGPSSSSSSSSSWPSPLPPPALAVLPPHEQAPATEASAAEERLDDVLLHAQFPIEDDNDIFLDI